MHNVLCASVLVIIMMPSVFMFLMCVLAHRNTHLRGCVCFLFYGLDSLRTLAHLRPRGLTECVIVPNSGDNTNLFCSNPLSLSLFTLSDPF